jgi:hypothetical protein
MLRHSPWLALLILVMLGPTAAPVRAQVQTGSMRCGQAPAGGASSCGTLTISSGSMYPEKLIAIASADPNFTITADPCSGTDLIYNSCSVSVSFTPPAGAVTGTQSGTVQISYQICGYQEDGTEVCGGIISKGVAISGSVTTGAPVDGSPATTVKAAPIPNPVAGHADYSYLTQCRPNLSTQQFCVVVPL